MASVLARAAECRTSYGKKKEMGLKTNTTPTLELCMSEDDLSSFHALLQAGVKVDAQVGKSVKATFIEEFGLNSKHIDQIQTVFLDSKAVDDLDASVIRDGSVLALSSAMPGLVGATLRRGSYYAAMRSQITAADTEDKDAVALQPGMITLKLFNLVLAELAPIFLKRGIWVEKGAWQDFLAAHAGDIWKHCREACLDGCRIAPETIRELSWPEVDELICVRVQTRGSDSATT